MGGLMNKIGKFYITTTLPYVNADPHIGFALEVVQADIIARHHKFLGEEVVFNTGTDEHGLKIYRKALEEGKETQKYADENAAKFGKLKKSLNLDFTNFIRTTDPHHMAAAQEFWRRCENSGDIYKKNYRVKYCVGCELEKTDSELADGKCPIHPNLELELIDEENYFFRFSKYQKPLLELYEKYPDFVVPAHRLTEIRNFVASGLQDFSVSRLKSKMPWGVPVPGDDMQIMYVWFDALTNYISTLGWPEDDKKFGDFWGTKEKPNALQIAGKDNLRQQSAMWQAMLLSAGLPPSRQIIIHGFITSDGQKMSKSLGNVVNPFEIVEKYGTDALRFFLAHNMSPFEDSDFFWDRFKEAYNANLANGIGNLAARVMKLAEDNLEKAVRPEAAELPPEYREAMGKFEFNRATGYILARARAMDQKINEKEPFRLVKTDPEAGKKIIAELAEELYFIARLLEPFMPDTGAKIKKAVLANKKSAILFPRFS
ncbi:MAG: methionine--tRNA ligase [Patescibacteria group bacterium]